MTALLRTRGSTSEMARLFGAEADPQLDWRESIWPGEQVPVVLQTNDRRRVTTLAWGLPQSAFHRALPAPQRTSLFTRDLVPDASRLRHVAGLERCLIVVESFAYPTGDRGACMREWIGLGEHPLTAWAGYWLPEAKACAGNVVRSNAVVEARSDVMPRLLRPAQWGEWLAGASLISLGPAYDDVDFYRETFGERWSTGGVELDPMPRLAASA
jgi:putative SOS response-associated peptidase YedK